MFRAVPLSIIRSFSLYTQQYTQVCWQLAARNLSTNLYDIYHCCVYNAKLLMMDRGTVRNMWSFIAVCTVQKLLMMDRGTVRNIWSFIAVCTVQNSWWWTEKLYETCSFIAVCTVQNSWWWTEELSETCGDLLLCVQCKTRDDGQRNCPKHVEFYRCVYSAKLLMMDRGTVRNMWRFTAVCTVQKLLRMDRGTVETCRVLLLCVQCKTPDDGKRNCPKHVEFYSKNKFDKLVHLVGFITKQQIKGTQHEACPTITCPIPLKLSDKVSLR